MLLALALIESVFAIGGDRGLCMRDSDDIKSLFKTFGGDPDMYVGNVSDEEGYLKRWPLLAATDVVISDSPEYKESEHVPYAQAKTHIETVVPLVEMSMPVSSDRFNGAGSFMPERCVKTLFGSESQTKAMNASGSDTSVLAEIFRRLERSGNDNSSGVIDPLKKLRL